MWPKLSADRKFTLWHIIYVQYSLENSTMSITKKRDAKTAVVDTGPYILSTLAAHGLEDGE